MDLAIEPGVAFARENVDLIVDQNTDEEPSHSRVLSRTTERMVAALRSPRGLVLLLTPSARAIGITVRWSQPGASADIPRRLRPWITDASWVDRTGVHGLNREAVAAARRAPPSFGPCCSPGDESVVALVGDVPSLLLARATTNRDTRHRLLGTVVERLRMSGGRGASGGDAVIFPERGRSGTAGDVAIRLARPPPRARRRGCCR